VGSNPTPRAYNNFIFFIIGCSDLFEISYFSKYTSESRGIQSGILPCRAVIHVVDQETEKEKENEKSTQAINSLLKLAQRNNFKRISIPAISTGIFGFPR
jgi:hypothetical protein